MSAADLTARVRIYEPTAAGATTDSLTLDAGDGNHVTLFADDLADRLLLWVQELDEAAGRKPRAAVDLDTLTWLAAPNQHYTPDETARRTVKRLEQAGVTGDVLNRLREHIGGRTAPKDALRRISQEMFGDGHGCSTQAVDEILNPSEAISHLDLQAQISTPVDTWTYCAVHDHCTLTEDLNDSQGVRWCIKAADDGEACDLRTLTAGGRA